MKEPRAREWKKYVLAVEDSSDRVCQLRMRGTIKRSEEDQENYVSVIVTHGWWAGGKSQRQQARVAACALLFLILPLSLRLFPSCGYMN